MQLLLAEEEEERAYRKGAAHGYRLGAEHGYRLAGSDAAAAPDPSLSIDAATTLSGSSPQLGAPPAEGDDSAQHGDFDEVEEEESTLSALRRRLWQ